jgi:hypothetical protein
MEEGVDQRMTDEDILDLARLVNDDSYKTMTTEYRKDRVRVIAGD